MSNVSKFIPSNDGVEAKNTDVSSELFKDTSTKSSFKVSSTKLPAKQSGFFTKLKNILFYEIKVELTPYEQKIENEINDFLHQEITWASLKEAMFSEVTFGKKK